MKQEEIAKALGLSKTTVSRALSGKGRIGEDTVKRINAYIEAENRKPLISSTLKRNICVALPGDGMNSGNAFFAECLYGACEAASNLDYNVIVVKSTDSDISEIQRVVEEEKADGIILTRSLEDDRALNYLSSINFPVAVAGHCDFNNVICADIDNEKASKELTSLMIAKGYKRFTAIIGDLNYKVNRSRLDGFKKAVAESGLPLDKQVIYSGSIFTEHLNSVASDILNKRTECLICGDDEMTVKVMSWLKNEGYRIPKDVAIASLYNSTVLGALTPSVTAIDVPARSVGNQLAIQLISCLEKENYDTKKDVDYEILIRKSTQKIS